MKTTSNIVLIVCLGFTFTASHPALAADADDAALRPATVNLSPGAKYADEARRFQGIPGLERTKNGRLWATWYAGGITEGPENYVILTTSGDDGRTWSKPKLVVDPPGEVRAFDPCLWLDPDGRLWLFWAQGYSHWDGRGGVWAIVAETPDDENPTWSAPRRLCHGIMMNKPTVTSSGQWLLPAAVWPFGPLRVKNPAHCHDLGKLGGTNVVCSNDRGATWRLLGQAPVPKTACDEHMIVERGDGSLWLLARTRYGIGESLSTDGGKTWSDGRPSSIKHTTARFFIRRLNSGKLLLVKHGPIDQRTGRSHLTAYLSDDDGKSWQGGLLLDERRGVSYPDGAQSPDGTVYIIYDYSRTGEKKILMAAFSEEDVMQKKIVSKEGRLRVLVNQASGPPVPARKPVKITFANNNDGQTLLAGKAATIDASEGTVAKLEPRAVLFTNRKYRVANLPKPLLGKTFVRGSIDRMRAVCREAGVVYILTPSKGRNQDSLAEALEKNGYRKAAVGEFMLFGNIIGNVCSVFQKRVEKGETIEFGKWGVLAY
ncbi:MAG: sialidase family protein [Planctomycetota bacterium]|nr:sialidase family protein [Planctomycetota bacterium]